MRLDCIDLIRFGHFCGERIEFPARQPDYYVLYGENEAGKSTLLRAISALLFGVPAKTPDAHSCKGPELRIGATISDGTGARIPVLKNVTPALFDNPDEDGPGKKRFSFRRRKGTSGTLLNVNEGQIPEDSLAPFLRELDQERFEQFFGLTHDRLRQGGQELLQGKGDVGSALFQSEGLLDLRRLQEKLALEAKEIFSPRSRTKAIGRILGEYREAKAEIMRLAISGPTVRQKQTELEAAKRTLESLKAERILLQQALDRLRRIKSNKPDLARLQVLRTVLAALDKVPLLPMDARRQFGEAASVLANANHQINTLSHDTAQREKRITELPTNSLFITHESEIEDLNAGTSAYIQSVGDRGKRLREQEEATQLAQSAWKEIWPQPVAEAENLKNIYSSKEEILKLVADHKGLIAGLLTAEDELKNVAQEQQLLEEQLAQHPDVADPGGLVAAIEHAKSMGDTESVSARLQREIDRLTKNAQRQMQKLALWSGSIQELENLKTPLLATIDQYAREWERMAATRKEVALRHANALEIIRLKEGELGSLISQVSGAGESELASVRARRDELWQLIRAATFDKKMSRAEAEKRSSASLPLADAFADQLGKADQIADLRFAHAQAVAIHDRLVKEITVAHGEQQRIETESEQLETAERELRGRWNTEWSALGAAPLSPAEMKEWMLARQSVLDQLAQAREKQDELESLQQSAATAAFQITAKWVALEPNLSSANESLPVLLRMAEAFAKQRESERRARNEILRQMKSLSVEKRRTKLAECKQRLAEWSKKWAPNLAALGLPESSTPDQVARALTVLEKTLDHLKDAERLQYRIKRIGDNIEQFETRLARLVAVLEPSSQPGAALPAHNVAKQFHMQLLELRNAETERKALHEQNDKDRITMEGYRQRVQQATATLEKLRSLTNCNDGEDHQLEAAIAASEEKAEKKADYERICTGLIERNANADLIHIEQEASAYDVDSLCSEIDEKEARFEAVVDEISHAAGRQGELSNEFERLESTEEAALQGQKAEEALAQLRPAVAQYLRLRLAAEVLQQAIESYREKHQGPILTRASELFSRLTLGRHSGLTSDFGEDDKPVLVAIRRNGERVHVEGLSDGTRDQLYLALRLAAIEHHVRTVAPCPVIFDDLLINSDDARSSAALNVIGELARCTQVLFFTHHRRLVELGAEAGAQLVELDSIATAAVA